MENVKRFEEDSFCVSLSRPHTDSDLGLCDSTTQISEACLEDFPTGKTSARTRNSNSTSDDNDSEKKEKRRKQKRDYAARRRVQNKRQLDSLELANRKLGRRSKRQRQQIEQLKTWAMYARSYLSLCCQLLAYRPACQQSPHVLLTAGPAPGPAFLTPVAPEAEAASSSSSSSSSPLSSYYSSASSSSLLDESEVLETSASAVTGNTQTTGRDPDQPPDPDSNRECTRQTVSTGVEGNLFAQDPTIWSTLAMGLEDQKLQDLVLCLSKSCPRGPLSFSGIEENVAEADADDGDDVGLNVLGCGADTLGTTVAALEWESIARNSEISGIWDQIAIF